jgi:hypothetical protein
MTDSDSYTINSVGKDLKGNDAAGVICVTFECDGKEQCLGGFTLTDADTLKSELSNYLAAYKVGLSQEGIVEKKEDLDKDVQALIGKKQEANPES